MTRPSTAARSRGSSTVGEDERGMADSRLGAGPSRSYRSRTMGRSDDRPRLPTGTVTFLLTDIEGSTPTWGGLAIRLEPVGRLVRPLRHLFRSGVTVSYCGRPVGRYTWIVTPPGVGRDST